MNFISRCFYIAIISGKKSDETSFITNIYFFRVALPLINLIYGMRRGKNYLEFFLEILRSFAPKYKRNLRRWNRES